MGELNLNGRLQDEPLPLLLQQIFAAQATGVLRLEARVGRHEIFSREGYPVSVSLPGSAELLGKVLVEMGILDEETHKRTLAEPPPKGMKYGAWLIEKGLVTADHMRLALKAQVRRKLHRLFFINEGQFSFHPGEHHQGLEAHESLRIHPARAIYQGVRSAWSADRLQGALFLLQDRAIKCALDDQQVARYGLGQEDGRVAELLRKGYWLLPDLIEAAGLPVQPVHALVYAFYVTEALDVRGAGEVPRLRKKTPVPAEGSVATKLPQAPRVTETSGAHRVVPSIDDARKELLAKAKVVETEDLFAVLGLTDTATKEQVKAAYFEGAKKYHPDRLTSMGLESLRTEAEKVFRRLSEAYGALYDDARREEYKKTLAQPKVAQADEHAKAMKIVEAEMAFRRGEICLRRNDFSGAVRELEAAVSGNPQEGEYLAWLTWARLNANQMTWPDAKPRLVEATRLSPKCGRAFYFLGLALKEEKDLDRAYGAFKKALELDARLLEAEREMRLLQMRREKEAKGGGLFDRFRRR